MRPASILAGLVPPTEGESMPNQELVCEDCKQVFELTEEQRKYYAETAYTLPSRCDACEERRQAEKNAKKAARRPTKKRRW